MNRFKITNLPLTGLKLIQRHRLGDARGFLSRLFCPEELTAASWTNPIAQINHSLTVQCGTIRGLHYQNEPHADMKLVSCIRGEIWDIAIDLRSNSPTFLHSYAQTLSADNCYAMLIPKGFAHGYQTLTDDCELIYLHSASYIPEAEAGLRFNDPLLSISWPIPVTEVSSRDLGHPLMSKKFKGFAFEE